MALLVPSHGVVVEVVYGTIGSLTLGGCRGGVWHYWFPHMGWL